ncbi:MAG: flotillin family protein [Candidatus Cellulosilyticum pullistercoris]|uniref:Flotillin family protein n=1 Tax=Candidatus Cellulosilyticum pullistercoris TaxID=2838521 RepID=A0A9E2KC90_9FIRM|nr:flotillin family protein [Candidatus Cellulosilyticum pullistercoris]
MENLTGIPWGIIGIVLGIFLIVAIILSMWKKIPQDKAAVITGLKKRVITGGGGIVIPLLERIDSISLESMKLDVRTNGAMTSQGVPINTDGVAVIKVRNDKHSILAAIEQFSATKESETVKIISDVSREVLEGKLREIISKLTVEEIYNDRESFGAKVHEVAGTDLSEMGLEIKTLTIKDISDNNGYLKALGEARIAEVKKNAQIAVAEANKETQIKTSEAQRLGQTASIEAETAIAEANKIKNIKQLAFEKEQFAAKADADAAYDIQRNITQKQITDTEMDAEVLKQQRLKDVETEKIQISIVTEQKNIELAQKKAERKEKELLETMIKPAEAQKAKEQLNAEAEKYKEIAEAQARAEALKLQAAAEAEARKLQAAAEAEALKLQAKAQAEQIQLQGLAEAEIIKQKGLAEAESIKMQGLAEAETMEKKAEAYAKYNDAGKMEMLVSILPEVAKHVAEPMSRIEKIIVMDGNGDGNSATSVAKTVSSTMATVMESVKEMTGFDLAETMKASTYEAQVNKNVTISGLEPTCIGANKLSLDEAASSKTE